MTQVFLLVASSSPWTVPADFQTAEPDINGWDVSNGSGDAIGADASRQSVGQSFIPPNNMTLTSIDVYMRKTGTPTDNVFVTINQGAYNSAALATSTSIAASSFTGSYVATTFTFPTPIALTAGTSYFFEFWRSGSLDSTNCTLVDSNPSVDYPDGTSYFWNGSTISDLGADLIFIVHGAKHTVELVSAGGNGRLGTTGTSGRGGGGGGGGGYAQLAYSSGTMTPGVTTIPFVVGTGGTSASATTTQWENTGGGTNEYLLPNGGTSVGTTGGAAGGGLVTSGTPAIVYTTTIDNAGAAGGSAQAGAVGGGGGGGGTGGPLGVGGSGFTANSTSGGGGGGANNGATGNAASATGGTGSSGTGGSTGNPASAGTGNSGGGGSTTVSTAVATTGGNGGSGTDFDGTHGCGGGGGGSGSNSGNVVATNKGGAGGLYGGGGGGTGSIRGSVGTSAGGAGAAGLIVITYTPAAKSYAYSDDLSNFSPYVPLPRRRVGFDPHQYLVGAGFGFVPTAYVPPQPQPPHRGVERSGTIMVGDAGIQAPFIPPAPTIAPPDIPLLARARRNVMDYAEINQDAPFQRFFPAGWEVQPPQPPRFAPTARKFGGLARGDDGTADKLNFFYPAGWEIQPPQPPQTRPERFGPMAPREDGVADIFRPFRPFAFEVQPPLVKHPRPERFAAIAPREDGLEAALVVAATFTYSPDAWADQIRRRAFRWFPANDAQVDSPFANFYPVGWEVPGPQLPAQARAWRAILHPINVDAPFISSAAPPFFAADPAPLRRPSKAVPGFEAFALPAMPWLLTSFESPSSYPAKTNRAGATLPPGNIDALFVPASSTQPWGWEFAQATLRWAAPRAGGLIQAPGPDSPLIVFSPQGWPVWAAEPSRRRVERAGAIAASSFIEASLVAAQQQSWGWDLAPLALRSKMRPAGWLTAISGSDSPLVAFSPLGWAALLAEPPRRRWERAAGLARGDDGTQFGLIGFRPMGWEVQPHQPQHVRFERAAAGMIGDPGNEGTFSFITQPIVFGFDGPRIEYRPRRERAGALALGSPGNDAALITWRFAGWEGPPLALRARMGREVGQIALPNVPPIVPPIVGWEPVPAALRANARRLASIPEPIFPLAAAPPVLFVDGVRIEHRPRRSRDLGLFDQGIVPSRAPVVVGWETNPSGLLMRRVPRAVPSGADQPADRLRVFTPHGFDAQPTVSRVRPRPPQSTDIHATFVSVPAVIRFGWEFWHPLLRQQPNRRFVGALEWQRLDFRPRPIAGGPNLSFARDLGLWRVTAADQPVYVAAGADLARFSCKGTESVDGTQRIMGTYEIDTELEIIGTFADSLTGQAGDPTVITLFLRDPTGAVQQLTYPADLSKDAVGEYSYKLAPTISGTWSYKWQGTGAVIATSPDANFTVKSSSLITG